MSIQSEAMKRYFALNGIKNRDIAEAMGVTPSNVSNMLAGRDEHASSLPSLNAGLRTLCRREKLPPVSTYWARHTWASLAMELDAPIEAISAALGHSYGARVTVGYVNMSSKRVDELNRRVIDFALYDKLKKD